MSPKIYTAYNKRRCRLSVGQLISTWQNTGSYKSYPNLLVVTRETYVFGNPESKPL
jgi:hypothetical protein